MYCIVDFAKAGDPRILEIQGVVWFLTQDLAWEYYHFQKEELKNKQLAYCKSENDLHLHFNTNSEYIKRMKTKTRLTILGKEGVITDISIGVSKSDPAGELGVQVKEYDTELNYLGSIGYKTESGDEHWAYFNQIEC